MPPIDKDEFDPAVEPEAEKSHRLVRAAIGAAPLFAGTALEILNALVEDPYNRRRTQWLRALSDAVNALEADIKRLEQDSENRGVVLSAILQSTDVALRTGDEGVHRRLIQLVVHAIRERATDEELIVVYLSTLRQMTSSHINLVEFIASRDHYQHGGDLKEKEQEFFEEVRQMEGLQSAIPVTRLLSDLEGFHLIYSPPGSPWSTGQTNYCTMKPTEFAVGLLSYVEDI